VKKTMIFVITAAFAIILTAAPHARAQLKHVAVVETERDPSANISRAEAMEITAVLRREAINNLPRGRYNIMTNETIMSMGGSVLEECAEENCVISLGEKIGADYIVRGMIRKIGTKLSLTVEIHEIDQGMLVVLSDPVRAEKIEELLDMAAGACGSMYKKFLNEASAAQKTQAQQTISPQTQPTPQPPAPTPTPTYQQSVPTPTLGTFTDSRDKKTYKTVVIGGNRYMVENLNYKKGKSWCYGNNNSNCDKYGRLYDWKTAKTVCPAGFHLPSRQEWNNLVTAVGGKEVAGKKLLLRTFST
jgi:TolB-like protein